MCSTIVDQQRLDAAFLASVRTPTGCANAHATPPVVDGSGSLSGLADGLARLQPGTEELVRVAGHAGRLLSPAVHDALIDFADRPDRSGALLLRNLPIGELPATPASPTAAVEKDRVSELTLLAVARRLGQPVGYEPEHGGDLIQNIVPIPSAAERQVSTSSRVSLMFHTEAAFHPHRPRYLLLLCLRGDPSAVTTLSSIHEVIHLLTRREREALFQRRFRTAVDESYLHGRTNVLGDPMPVLSGDRDAPTMVFDADLMVGTDTEADAALRSLGHAVSTVHTGVVLEPGDLLVVDNAVAVHGRSPFTPRFDGTDRWLQRTMVVTDLRASAGDRVGRVITTVFGTPPAPVDVPDYSGSSSCPGRTVSKPA